MANNIFLKLSNNSLFSGALIGFFVKIISSVCAFFLNLIVARDLGAEQSGYFFLAQGVIIFIANISRQGFDSALIRYVASYNIYRDNRRICSLSVYAVFRTLTISVVFSILIYIFSDPISIVIFSKPTFCETLKISAWIIPGLSIVQLIGYCFQGKKEIASAMLYQTAFVATIGLGCFYIFSPNTSEYAIKLYLSCVYFASIIAIMHWFYQFDEYYFKYDDVEKKKVNNTIKSMFMILCMTQLTQWSGQFILGAFATSSQIALFATALRTAMLISFILIAVNAIAAPRFAESFRTGNMDDIKSVALSSSRMMTIAAFPVLVIMWLFAPLIMGLFGSEFSSAGNVLRILAFGQFINVITGSVGYLLQMTGNEVTLRNNMFISCIVLFICSFLFIPILGVTGAAISTSISIATQNILCVYKVKQKLGFNTLVFWK